MRKLDISAKYTPDSDRVDILVGFIDPDTDVLHPEEIMEGFAQVYVGSIPQTVVWEFDKFNGTGTDDDGTGGYIKLFWSKPYADTYNISIRVIVVDVNSDTHSRTVSISRVDSDSKLIVAQNTDNNPFLTDYDKRTIRDGISDTDISEV